MIQPVWPACPSQSRSDKSRAPHSADSTATATLPLESRLETKAGPSAGLCGASDPPCEWTPDFVMLRALFFAPLAYGLVDPQTIISLVEQWFYPALLGTLVIASLGLPIPEDIPLIAAGVVLKLQPQSASWAGALLTALAGIMSGDLVLYMMGRRWGRDVVNHRSVNWIITPERYQYAMNSFRKRGVWFVFFGRFVMGIRAVMCLTAGATHFPYWRFFLADLAGAVLSIPLFVVLGYLFADTLAILFKRLAEIQGAVAAVVVIGGGLFVWYEYRKFSAISRKMRAAKAIEPTVKAAATAETPPARS